MRSAHYKHYSLSELEWLVMPPILTGQCAVMEAGANDKQVPVAVALWASVSEQVDKRLSENFTTPVKLRPDEWRCGDIPWLIDAVGDAKAVPILLKMIQETPLKGRKVKMRTHGADSRARVGLLNPN
jgi:cytolysin-activating lysine-acyltransferase